MSCSEAVHPLLGHLTPSAWQSVDTISVLWRILRLHQGFRWIIQSYPGYAQTILKGEVGEQEERMNDNLRVD